MSTSNHSDAVDAAKDLERSASRQWAFGDASSWNDYLGAPELHVEFRETSWMHMRRVFTETEPSTDEFPQERPEPELVSVEA